MIKIESRTAIDAIPPTVLDLQDPRVMSLEQCVFVSISDAGAKSGRNELL